MVSYGDGMNVSEDRIREARKGRSWLARHS